MTERRLSRPWLQLAAFCEDAEVDESGNLNIRKIIGRITFATDSPDAPSALPEVEWTLKFVLAVVPRSRTQRGLHFALSVMTPGGQHNRGPDVWFPFDSKLRGQTLIVPVSLRFPAGAGTYWVLVLADTAELTRIPLEVLYERTSPVKRSRTAPRRGRQASAVGAGGRQTGT